MSRRRGPQPVTRPFTLMELLLVLFIVTLLMGMVGGTYAALGGKQKSASATRILSQKLYLCRQYAIKEREKVALLLPDVGEVTAKEYQASSLRPAIVSGGASPFTFVSYVPQSEWTYLPGGAFVKEQTTDLASECSGVKFPNDTDAALAGTVRCIVFAPNGSLVDATPVALWVGRGKETTPYTALEDRYKLEINWLTGRTSFAIVPE